MTRQDLILWGSPATLENNILRFLNYPGSANLSNLPEPMQRHVANEITKATQDSGLSPEYLGPPEPQQIKFMRETLGTNQTVTAQFLGVSLQTWNNWEKGRRAMPARKFQELCKLVENDIETDRKARIGIR